jgi:hypothetical protein
LSDSRYTSRVVNVEDRIFKIQVLNFENGNFISVSEGSEKIGSMMASIGTGFIPATTTIIPGKTSPLFLKLISEQVSASTKGIAIVSAFVEKELKPETTKALMNSILEIVQNE